MSVARAHLPADAVMLTPPICTMGEKAHFAQYDVFATLGNGRHLMMGDDPRLPKMPARPRLADFFRHRFVPMVANHLLQRASLAKKKGLDEKVIIACLLHDIAMAGLITSDHGYWGARLIEPYVDEEVSRTKVETAVLTRVYALVDSPGAPPPAPLNPSARSRRAFPAPRRRHRYPGCRGLARRPHSNTAPQC